MYIYIYLYITPFMKISHVSRKEMHTLIRSYFFDTAILICFLFAGVSCGFKCGPVYALEGSAIVKKKL